MNPAPERSPLTSGERWTYGSIAFLFGALIVAEIATGFTPAKLGGVMVLLWWIPLLVLHEAAHALVAKVLGWHVGQVVLGMGSTWKTLQVGGVPVQLRTVPILGFVQCVPTHLKSPQLRNACIYAAGPLSEIILAFVIIAAVGGSDRLFAENTHYGWLALQALTIAAFTQGIINLIPFSSGSAGKDTPNDGLGIILSFRWSDEVYAAWMEEFREKGAAMFDPRTDQDDRLEWWKEDRRL